MAGYGAQDLCEDSELDYGFIKKKTKSKNSQAQTPETNERKPAQKTPAL
jgi:hypothetical protein